MNELIARLAIARQQRMFLLNAAHELRTPLSALTLQIGNLSQSRGSDLEERLSELSASARRVSALTDKLLKISRFEGQPLAAPTQVFDLAETVKDMVSGLLVAADEKQLDLGFAALAEGAWIRIDSDDPEGIDRDNRHQRRALHAERGVRQTLRLRAAATRY